MIVALDFDDFHPSEPENCLDSIYWLMARLPNIKLSMFTTPCLRGQALYKSRGWCNQVRKLIENENLCIGIHGLYHSRLEFSNITELAAEEKILLAEKYLEMAGLPYKKVFRGPHWGINEATYKVLIDLGYSGVYTHTDHLALAKRFSDSIPSIIYNWNLSNSSPDMSSNQGLLGHGHTHNTCDNGIREVRKSLVNILDNNFIKFEFLDHPVITACCLVQKDF